ncbi:MAG TPA: L-seryl-tRNA(Sec) selenium transferase [Syntrophales bacterium]|nr:L-seryl-tRNA(Sec) selenium transferase [Syntrophales bacterium]
MTKDLNALLRNLPKIDEIIHLVEKAGPAGKIPREYMVRMVREEVQETRDRLRKEGTTASIPSAESSARRVLERLDLLGRPGLRMVVNATGIVLHTNLGRAPLAGEALARLIEAAQGYSNLEYDLAAGERGLRYDHVRPLLCALTGAEDALVVNNNAAAVLLVLNTLAEGREAVVSRGELIEIGGEFRIPEVMEKSGAVLREVGTTNRTHRSDYERAVGERTALILKVHTSNFRVRGFTGEVPLAELVRIGHERAVPVMNDLGSGCFIDLARYGLTDEPTVRDAVATGVDVVTFSGDKLLGGPQAGIVLGKRSFIERIARNPLNRALRIDKLTLAALEGTLRLYLDRESAPGSLPVFRSLLETPKQVKRKARILVRKLKPLGAFLDVALKSGVSLVGGGALPTEELETVLVALRPKTLSASSLGKRLRALDVPVVGRVSQEEVLLDLRTVVEEEIAFIEKGLKRIAGEERTGEEPPR